MSDLSASRPTIQIEETKFKAAASESTMQRLGAGVNMANKAYNTHSWYLQGDQLDFDPVNTSDIFQWGGMRSFFWDPEFIGISVWAFGSGLTSFLEFDIVAFATNGTSFSDTSGTIFTTRPKWTPAFILSGNEFWHYSLLDTSSIHVPSGTIQAPVLNASAALLTRANWITLNILNVATRMQNVRIDLHWRPKAG